MQKKRNSKKTKWHKLKRILFPEQIIFLVAYFLISIFIQQLYSEYFNDLGLDIPNINNLIIILSGVSLVISVVNKRFGSLLILLPSIYFLIPTSLQVQISNFIDIHFLGALLTSVSLMYAIVYGHVRSFTFLFFVGFTLIICNVQVAIAVCLGYILLRFIYLVITDNYTIFTTLGFKKSVFYLTKGFLFWSPLLLFIIPIQVIKKQINTKLCNEIYTSTPVDTIQFHFKDELSDALISQFRPNKNISTILFVNSINQNTPTSTTYKILNEIDLSESKVDKVDSTLNNLLTKELGKEDPLNYLNYTIALNTLDVLADTSKNYEQYEMVTHVKGNNKNYPLMIILKDISINSRPDHVSVSLQNNINLSITAVFKSLSNTVCEKISEETSEINKSITNIGDKGFDVLHDAKIDLVNQINMHQYTTSKAITKEYNEIFPEPLLEIEKCRFWEIRKLISNEIKRSVNKKYIKEKTAAKAKIDNKVNKIYDDIRAQVDIKFRQLERMQKNVINKADLENFMNISTVVNKAVKETFNNLNHSTIEAVKSIFWVLFFYSMLSAITMFYLILQTFLYIFARVTISKKNNVFATLNTTNKRQAKGEIKKCGDTYTILSSQKDIYYIARSFEPSGRPPSFCIPFKTTSIIARLRSRTYSMNKVILNRKGSSVHFRATGSAEFVEWTLKENEKVVFNYKNLVAISGKIKLKSVVNFRITTLILGKLFHKVAYGPGKLVLMTMGRPIISGERASNISLAQSRIVAFNSGTRFDIDSELNLIDVYLSGFYLQKMPADLIIIDADAKGKANLGLIQYVKGLIWPF